MDWSDSIVLIQQQPISSVGLGLGVLGSFSDTNTNNNVDGSANTNSNNSNNSNTDMNMSVEDIDIDNDNQYTSMVNTSHISNTPQSQSQSYIHSEKGLVVYIHRKKNTALYKIDVTEQLTVNTTTTISTTISGSGGSNSNSNSYIW